MLAGRLRAGRRRHFVGRGAGLELFRAALTGERSDCAVLYVHGMGGIGKTSLLRLLADEAFEAGRTVVWLDTGELGEAEQRDAAVEKVAAPGVVLFVDSVELQPQLDAWLQYELLPGLGDDGLAVVASRLPPDPDWRADVAWLDTLRVIGLDELTDEEAQALLTMRGVTPAVQQEIVAITGGHPFALSLAAEEASGRSSWTLQADLICTLLGRIVRPVPSPLHQQALEICAQALTTSAELLRSVLGQETAEVFSWLRDQPYIEAGPYGVAPRSMVRRLIDSELRWRDAEQHAILYRRIRSYLLARIERQGGTLLLRTLQAYNYLVKLTEEVDTFTVWSGGEDIEETTYRQADRPVLVEMATATEGAESARILEFWLDRSPESFWIYREAGTDKPLAFAAFIRSGHPDPDELAVDPVLRAAWQHSQEARPLRPGEQLAILRYAVVPAAYQRPSPAMDLIQARNFAEWLRSARLAWSYILVEDAEFWGPHMRYLDHHPVADGRLFARDWRVQPVHTWMEERTVRKLEGPRSGVRLTVMTWNEFEEAIRSALRHWHRPRELAANPLLRSRLVAASAVGDTADPIDTLRGVLVRSVDQLADDPANRQLDDVLRTTFFADVPTQEAAADRLGLPFSTYRRHLSRGIERVTELLWSQELDGGEQELSTSWSGR
jgi:hypothetical protein